MRLTLNIFTLQNVLRLCSAHLVKNLLSLFLMTQLCEKVKIQHYSHSHRLINESSRFSLKYFIMPLWQSFVTLLERTRLFETSQRRTSVP